MSDSAANATCTRDTELRLLLEQLPVVLWAVDQDLRFTLSEGNGLRSVGIQPGQVVGMTMYELLQTTDPNEESIRRHRQAIAGEYIEYETEWLQHTFHCRLEPRRDQDGAIVGCWGCALDVTDCKWRERQAELQRQAIAENVPAFILLIDAEARIHYVNRLNPGIEREQIVGASIYDFLPIARADDFRRNLARLFAEKTPFTVEGHVESPPGYARTYQGRVVPFPTSSGPELAVLVAADITESRRADDTIAAQQAKLLHVARLSTMGQMVAAFSHEVTQPLSAITNFAATCLMLLEQNPNVDPRLVRNLTAISDQASRAGNILSSMRTFARRGQLPQVETDLGDVVTAAVSLITGELRARRVAVRVALPPTPLKVRVDAVQIQQVLINIIKNGCDAIESLPGAPREIDIRCSQDASRAIIEVSDHGPGLNDDVAAHLFSPFFTTKADGMGLGLSICRDIVTSHSGSLEARNNVDGGASFRISLPILELTTHGAAANGQRDRRADNLSDRR